MKVCVRVCVCMCVCVCVRAHVCAYRLQWMGHLARMDDSCNEKRVEMVTVKHFAAARQDNVTVEYAKFTCDTCQRPSLEEKERHHRAQKPDQTMATAGMISVS